MNLFMINKEFSCAPSFKINNYSHFSSSSFFVCLQRRDICERGKLFMCQNNIHGIFENILLYNYFIVISEFIINTNFILITNLQ